MKNIHLIYDYIDPIKVRIRNNPVEIKITGDKFNSLSLYNLAGRLKFLRQFKFLHWEIVINLGRIEFTDKITYLIFDALLYDFLKNTGFNVKIKFKINMGLIHNMGFTSTAIYRSWDSFGRINKNKFIEIYKKSFYANTTIYRRLVTAEELCDNSKPSKIYSELSTILKQYSKDEEFIESISEVVSELVCNVSSHTNGDCLIDINFNDDLKFRDLVGKRCTGINVAVINFSDNRLFDLIKTNIKEKNYAVDDELYSKIYRAYEVHKSFFNDDYTEDDYFFVTAFQNHVSTRRLISGKGGTGLTKLIEKIIDKTEKDYSYVLSGDNIIFYKTEYLKLSNDKFIGFNEENDYFNSRPSLNVLNKSKLYIPGSVYQLLLIKEYEDGKNN